MEKRIVLQDQTAFPSTELMTFGLTKREYFSALAMQAIITGLGGYMGLYDDVPEKLSYPDMSNAVIIADELIKALNK